MIPLLLLLRSSTASIETPLFSWDFTGASLPSGVTFSRTGSATDDQTGTVLTFADGVPRLGPKGILIEEQRTNIVKNSSSYASGWSDERVTASITEADAAAGNNAIKITETATTGSHDVYANIGHLTSGTRYTSSVMLNGRTRKNAGFTLATSGLVVGGYTYLNADTDTVTTGLYGSGATQVTSSVRAVNSTWDRVSSTIDVGATAPHYLTNILFNDAGVTSYAGDTQYNATFFAPQIEAGFGATSWIPTSGTAVTRNADIVDGDASEINYAGGKLVIKATTPGFLDAGAAASPCLFLMSNASHYAGLFWERTTGKLFLFCSLSGGSVSLRSIGVLAVNESFTATIEWGAGGWSLQLNSETPATDTGSKVFTSALTAVTIGRSAVSYWNGYVESIKFYDGGTYLDTAFLTSLPAEFTLARASSATDIVSGVITTYLTDEARVNDGLLIEREETNSLLNSQDFSGYTLAGVTRESMAYPAPDGTSNATRLTETATTGNHNIYLGQTVSYGGQKTFSLFVKSATKNKIAGSFCTSAFGTGTVQYFDTAPRTASPATFGATLLRSYSNDAVGDWNRLGASYQLVSSGTHYVGLVLSSDTGNIVSYTGNTGKSADFFGAMLTDKFGTTSYIPTSGAAVTRSPDIVTAVDPTIYSADVGMLDITVKLPAFCETKQPVLHWGNATESATVYKRPAMNRLMMLGDSILSAFSTYNPVSAYVSTALTNNLLAVAGTSIAQNKTMFQNCPYKEALSVVYIQVGLNDMNPLDGLTAADKIAAIQDLVDTVRADCPSETKIVIGTMSPCRQRWFDYYGATNGALAFARYLAMNEAIAGGGSTPITGVDARVTSHTTDLADVDGNLLAEYNHGDNIHTNNAGRAINGAAIAAGVNSVSFTNRNNQFVLETSGFSSDVAIVSTADASDGTEKTVKIRWRDGTWSLDGVSASQDAFSSALTFVTLGSDGTNWLNGRVKTIRRYA